MATESTPLLTSRAGQDAVDQGSSSSLSERRTAQGAKIAIPRRTVIVEPALLIFVVFGYPLHLASQLFIYDKFLASMAAKEGINVTSTPGESPGCEANQTDIANFLDRVQSSTSQFYSVLSATTGIPAFVMSLLLGPYSDKAGRKWCLIPPVVGTVLKAASYVLVVSLDLDLAWLLLGSLLDGFGGYFTTFVNGCGAYLCDVTTPENRIIRLSILEMCTLSSLILTPIGLGYLIQQVGYIYAFMASLCGLLIGLLYLILFVPETIMKNTTEPTPFCTTDHIKKTLELYTKDDVKGRRLKLIILTLVFLCGTLVGFITGVDTYFTKNRPLCWDSVEIGIYTAVYAGGSAVGGLVVAKTLKFCVSDNVVGMVAVLGGVGVNIYKSSVNSTIMMYFSVAFSTFSVLVTPSLRAILSKLVSEKQQGRLFGALASVEVLGTVVGTVTFNLIYSKTLYIAAGFVYITMAMVMVIGAILFSIYLFRIRMYPSKASTEGLCETHVTAPEDTSGFND